MGDRVLSRRELTVALFTRQLLHRDRPAAVQDAVRDLVQHELDRANSNYAQVEQIKRFAILDHDLSQETGELTPTLKVKRNVMHEKFADLVDSIYTAPR